MNTNFLIPALDCLNGGDGFIEFVNSAGSSEVKELLRAALGEQAGGTGLTSDQAEKLRELTSMAWHAHTWISYRFSFVDATTGIDVDETKLKDLPPESPVRIRANTSYCPDLEFLSDPLFPEAAFVYGFFRYLEQKNHAQWAVSIKTCAECGHFILDRSRGQVARFCSNACRAKGWRSNK